MKTSVIPTNLLRWLLSNNRGESADAVAQHLTGLPCYGGPDRAIKDCWPSDMGDVGRIIRLLDEVPEIAWMFERMSSCGPRWAAIVRVWDDLRDHEGDGQRQAEILAAALAGAEGLR